MRNAREIYRILFNKIFKEDGRVIADEYCLDMESPLGGKIPKTITIKDSKVTITFTDKTRHIFPYDNRVEFFDRLIEKKDGETENKTE